ncbi:sce7726 family protein [candidate division WOR-3 bacterium]|nr:sce7726 family protein [candidate division WOR-3 bacterium]
MVKTSDKEIRKVLLEHLYSNKDHLKIIEELDLTNARVDIATITKKYFCGYEIKSDKDTLRRLPIQILVYNYVFDKVTIVVGKSKYPKIVVPDFWGIVTAENEDGRVILTKKRSPKLNKNINKRWLSHKFWKSDIVNILKRLNLYKGKSRYDRGDLLEILMKNTSLNELRYYIRDILVKRSYVYFT